MLPSQSSGSNKNCSISVRAWWIHWCFTSFLVTKENNFFSAMTKSGTVCAEKQPFKWQSQVRFPMSLKPFPCSKLIREDDFENINTITPGYNCVCKCDLSSGMIHPTSDFEWVTCLFISLQAASSTFAAWNEFIFHLLIQGCKKLRMKCRITVIFLWRHAAWNIITLIYIAIRRITVQVSGLGVTHSIEKQRKMSTYF